MRDIKDLLFNLKNILVSEEFKKGAIQEAVMQASGIKIESKDIKIKNGVVYLTIKPIYQNEIFLKKEKILSGVESILGKKNIIDIR